MATAIEVEGGLGIQRRLTRLGRKHDKLAGLTVTYTAPYAVYVHEDLEAFHPGGGQAKFLEQPARQYRPDMINIVRRTLRRRGGTLRRGLSLAGQFLLRKSRELVPIDTGFLYSSGTVRIDRVVR